MSSFQERALKPNQLLKLFLFFGIIMSNEIKKFLVNIELTFEKCLKHYSNYIFYLTLS